MIRYIPAPAAEQMSEHLWSLSRPPQVRGIHDTQRMFSSIVVLDGSRWLAVDTAFSIRVHPDAELGGIADILQPYITAGYLPADTNEGLAAIVTAMRGQRLTVYDAFPAFFKAVSQTRDQMTARGLLPSPDPSI